MKLVKLVPKLLGLVLVTTAGAGVARVALAGGPAATDPLMKFRAPYDLNDYANPPSLLGFSTNCYTQLAAACPVQAMSPDGKTTTGEPLGGLASDRSIAMNTGTGYASDPQASDQPSSDSDDSDNQTQANRKPPLVQGVYAYVPASKNNGAGATSFEAKSYFCPFTKTKGLYNNVSVYTFQVAGKTYLVSRDKQGHVSTETPDTDPGSDSDYGKIKAVAAPATTCFELTDSRTNSPKRLMLEAERLMSPANIQACLNDNEEGIQAKLAYEKKNGTPDYQSAAKERSRLYAQVRNAFVNGCSSLYPRDRIPPNSMTDTSLTDQSFAVLNRYNATKIVAPSSSGTTSGPTAGGTSGAAIAPSP